MVSSRLLVALLRVDQVALVDLWPLGEDALVDRALRDQLDRERSGEVDLVLSPTRATS